MKTLTTICCALAACSDPDVVPASGAGTTVSNGVVNIDATKIPTLAACNSGEVVARNNGSTTGWECLPQLSLQVGKAAQAASADGATHAASADAATNAQKLNGRSADYYEPAADAATKVTSVAVSGTTPLTATGTTQVVLSLPPASNEQSGYLVAADYAKFSGKQDALATPAAPLALNAGVLSIGPATGGSSGSGALLNSDWTRFNAKQDALTPVSPITIDSGNISIAPATGGSSGSGALLNSDWTKFNAKAEKTGELGYIQNIAGGAPQSGASFRIDGSGQLGGNLAVGGNLTVANPPSGPANLNPIRGADFAFAPPANVPYWSGSPTSNGSPATGGPWTNTTQSIALPAAGTYLVIYQAGTWQNNASRPDQQYVRLAWSSGNSRLTLLSGVDGVPYQASGTVSIIAPVTVAGPDTVTVQAASYGGYVSSGGMSLYNASLMYIRIG